MANWKNVSEFPNTPEYAQAVQNWGNLDLSTLWHLTFFHKDHIGFLNSSLMHLNSLPAGDKSAYVTAIRGIFSKGGYTLPQIQNVYVRVAEAMPLVTWFGLFYPETWEWAMNVFIKKDLQQYIKAAIGSSKTLSDPTQLENYKKVCNRQLQQYAPSDWRQSIPPDLLSSFDSIFSGSGGFVTSTIEKYKDKFKQAAIVKASAKQNQAAALPTTNQAGKMMGVVIVGAFGIWGISKLLSKKGRK